MKALELAKIESEISSEAKSFISKFKKYLEKLRITADNFMEVLDRLLELNMLKRSLEARRKSIVDPLNQQVKKVNEIFKQYLKPLEEYDDILRQKIIEYRRQVEKEIELRNNELAVKALQQLDSVQPLGEGLNLPVLGSEIQLPATVHRGQGDVVVRKVLKWRVVDENSIPREYLKVDEKKISEAVDQGLEIPGVETYFDEEVVVKITI